MGTVTVETDSEVNESYKDVDGSYVPGTSTDFIWFMGWSDLAGFGYGETEGYVRFQNITIPQGATIVDAYTQFYGANYSPTSYGTASGNIYGINEDNTADLSSDPSGRSLTSASISFSFTGWSPLTANANSKTGDIGTIIQEIVNRAGWTSGNAMAFKFDPTVTSGDNFVYGAGNDGTYGGPAYDAELTITWKYLDSGLRIYKSSVIKIGKDPSTSSKFKLRKSGETLSIPLVSTGDADASPLRVHDGGSVKSVAKTT